MAPYRPRSSRPAPTRFAGRLSGVTAWASSSRLTSAGAAFSPFSRRSWIRRATAPATIGVAIDVPLSRSNSTARDGSLTGLPAASRGTGTVEVTFTPGATRSGFASP
jgi:hypothetical protein